MFIRKFYDMEAESSASTGSSEQQSIASLMASQGKMSHNEQPDIPVVSRQDMSSESYQDASPVETTNDDSYEVQEFRVPSTYEETPNSTNWQEVLRQQRPEEILMEMGYDEDSVHLLQELKDVDPKMVQILTNWKNDGDSVVEYLKELATDYTEMPSEEVMRRQLREEYPKASDRQLDILYRKEIVEKYNLDSMDEELVEEGKLLLDVRAESYREKLIQQQQEKLLPKYEKKVDETEIRAQEEFSNYKSNLLQDNLTRSLLETSVLSIGEGDDKFNYRIGDPQDVVNSLLDSETWAAKLFDVQVDSNGNEQYIPNIEKQLLISAILNDHKGFIREVGKYYKSLGGKATIDALDNPRPLGMASSGGGSGSEPRTPAEYMAKYGRLA